jgi:transcription elongation factor Elf1
MNFQFTPLDQAYQIHHVNQNTYSSLNSAKYSSQCMFCGNQNSVPLMERQDRGAFRQCTNPSCRKQFQATILSQPIANYQMSTQNPQNKTSQILQQSQIPIQEQSQSQVKTQELRESNIQNQGNLEPQFISKFKTNF